MVTDIITSLNEGRITMKFTEKLQLLRKENKYSQEYLAEACGVSRQAVSKWEAGSAYPEMDKIICISKIFGVSTDFLLKDEIDNPHLEENQSVHSSCGNSGSSSMDNDDRIFKGIIIKESICNELILDMVHIDKVDMWKTKDVPKYWTVIYFTSKEKDFPYKLSNVLTGNWFVDMKIKNTKIIVFKDKVLTYEIGNEKEKDSVIDYCRKMKISDDEMNWPE